MHLTYEVESMAEMAAIAGANDPKLSAVVSNACLEASLVHVRLLVEFLTGRPRPDGTRSQSALDVRPIDFIESWDLTPNASFDQWLRMADQHLVHLSRERARPAFPTQWNIRWVASAILDEFERFVRQAEAAGASHAPMFRDALLCGRLTLRSSDGSGTDG